MRKLLFAVVLLFVVFFGKAQEVPWEYIEPISGQVELADPDSAVMFIVQDTGSFQELKCIKLSAIVQFVNLNLNELDPIALDSINNSLRPDIEQNESDILNLQVIKQNELTLTTNNNSGVSTLINAVLNVPDYTFNGNLAVVTLTGSSENNYIASQRMSGTPGTTGFTGGNYVILNIAYLDDKYTFGTLAGTRTGNSESEAINVGITYFNDLTNSTVGTFELNSVYNSEVVPERKFVTYNGVEYVAIYIAAKVNGRLPNYYSFSGKTTMQPFVITSNDTLISNVSDFGSSYREQTFYTTSDFKVNGNALFSRSTLPSHGIIREELTDGTFSANLQSLSINGTDINTIISDSAATAKVDTLYFSNDTLYLTEGGKLFKAKIAPEIGDGYVSLLSFNASDGIITASDPVNGVKSTMSLDVRYGVLGSDNTWTGTNTYGSSSLGVRVWSTPRIDIIGNSSNSKILRFMNGGAFTSYISETSGNPYALTIRGYGGLTLDPNNGDLAIIVDSATTTNNLYYNKITRKVTYGAAQSGGTNYWFQSSGTLSPTTTTDKILLGGISNQGSYILQASGNTYLNGTLRAGNTTIAGYHSVSGITYLGGFVDQAFTYPLQIKGDILMQESGGVQLRMENTSASGISSILFLDENETNQFSIGYTNSSNEAIISTNSKPLGITANTTITGTVNSSSTMTATNFILSSDRRLKKQIQDLSKIDWVDKIKFKSFRMKGDDEFERYGVIAQQLEKINPELVRIDKDGIYSVAYVDLLVAKVARQDQQIKELQDALWLLTKRVEDLEDEK